MTEPPRPSWPDLARANAIIVDLGISVMQQRDAARNGSAPPTPAMVALARLLATTVPETAVRLPWLLAVAGPETRRAVALLARIEAEARTADATAGSGLDGGAGSSPGQASWLTTDEAARAIGVAHADSVRAAIRRGRLAGRKDPAGRWLVAAASIETYGRRADGAAGHAARR